MGPSLFFAALPLLILLGSLLVLRRPLTQSAPIAWLSALLIGAWSWEMPPELLTGAVLRGLFLTLDLLLIIFGALLFLEFLKRTGVAASLQHHLLDLSPDRRVQAVVIAWLFGGFLEGSAGFGTPAAIVAPLLVALGFPVLTSVLVALSANSTAVAFGAVGTPLRVGFSALDSTGVPMLTAAYSLLPGLMIPLLIVALVVRDYQSSPFRAWIEMVPWALWSGVAFLIPFLLFSLLGPEFPSLLGAPVGLLLVGLTLKRRFLLPAKISVKSDSGASLHPPSFTLSQAIAPYALLITILLVGKWIFGPLKWIIALPGPSTYTLNLFNPGFAFLSVLAFWVISRRIRLSDLRSSGIVASRALLKPFLSLFFVGGLVQTMMLSEIRAPGMISTLARELETGSLPFMSAALGAVGSFLAGSATVSNLLLGPVQNEMALNLGFPRPSILALQLVGAAAGNMLALPNVLAVQATVGLVNQERTILTRLAGPCLLYLGFAGILGALILKGGGS